MVKHLQKLFALVLVCCAFLGGSSEAWGQELIFHERMGVVTATTAISAHEANNGFNNIPLTMTTGGSVQAADVRKTSSILNDGADDANIFFSSSSTTDRGFAIEDINASNYTGLKVSFFYRKESATALPSLVLEFWNGTQYVNVPFSFTEAASAAQGWYQISNISLPSTAEINGLRLRWRLTSSAASCRLDEVRLTGTKGAPPADVTAPKIVTLTPENGAFDIPTTTTALSIKFDEPVVKGTGSIELRDATTDAVLQAINVAGNAVTVDKENVSIAVTLEAGIDYYVTIPATAFADLSGNAFAGITDPTTWEFSTAALPTPVLYTSEHNLFFGYVLPNQSKLLSFEVHGDDLTGDVTLTATGGFTMSVSLSGPFTSSLILSAADVMVGETIYVQYSPTAPVQSSGLITISSTDADNEQVVLLGTAFNGYAQNFNDCAFGGNLVGGWKQISLVGAQVWGCSSFGYNGTNGVQMNGFSAGAKENQDYLISPSLDLTNLKVPMLTFWSRSDFSGPAMTVLISTDYDGVSDPSTATWEPLNAGLPAVNSATWKQSTIDLSNYKEPNVHIAYYYTSTNASASRWTVDDFSVNTESYFVTTSNLNHSFGIVTPQEASISKSFTFSVLGLEQDLTLSVPADFKVSKDGNTFTQSITYTKEEAAANNTFFVRFTPTVEDYVLTGAISFVSGTQLNITRGSLVGSSKSKESTLDIVTWNIEWFGADKDHDGKTLGPANDDLQYANVKQAILALDADIYALQEIANDAKMAQLVGELPGYDFVKSDVFSYSIRPSSTPLTAQKLYLVYKTSTVKVKSQKVLLEQLYRDLLANTKVLPNYNPTVTTSTDEAKDDSFWSSGRLPFMVEVEANINGIKQNLHLLNIHARANSGTAIDRYNMRKYDLQVLKDSLDAQYPHVNLVMLGDYNDDVDVSVVGTNESTYKAFVDDARYNVLTLDLSKTGVGTYNGSSFLDHITVSQQLNDDYITGSIKIEDGFTSLIPSFYTTTSDHLPVSARFNLSATPVVTFAEATATKAEGAEKYNVNLTLSAAQATEQTVTVSVVSGGTTASATDYTVSGATNGVVTVTVPANATTASFELEISDDDLVEADEQVKFQITGKSANLVIGDANTYTLTITDNDKSTVNFAVAAASVNEGDGEVTINLALDQAPVSEQTVKVILGEGMVYTTDYTTTPAAANSIVTLTLPAGETSASVKVSLIDNSKVEADRALVLTLAEPSENLAIGTINVFTLSVADNDKSAIAFALSSSAANENAGEVTVELVLDQATVTEQNLKVALGLTTSLAYTSDFTTTPAPVSGVINLTVPAGASAASFKVNIVDDLAVEADEVLNLTITEVSNGLTIGAKPSHALTITDNDKSVVNFAAASLKVSEESGVTEVTLVLDQATVKEEQITVSVTNGAGVTYGTTGDYTTTPAVDNGNIIITVPAGATSAKFSINVIDDQLMEEDELISFSLASVSNKLAIGTTNEAFSFTIERNDLATGIADATKRQFKVYPNPATSYVNLVLPEKATTANINLSVWAVDGRKVFETTGTLENVNSNLNNRVSNLANGAYIIKVQAGKDIYQTRLMKK